MSANLILTDHDYEQLSSLVETAPPSVAGLLEEEINRASVVSAVSLPRDAVSMNSRVKFVDMDTRKETVVTLVYPKDADVAAGKISVFAPVGSALIGLRVGQVIDWPLPRGKKRRLKVVSVLFQPESV